MAPPVDPSLTTTSAPPPPKAALHRSDSWADPLGKVNLNLQLIVKNNQVYLQGIQAFKGEECKSLRIVKIMVAFYKALVVMPQQLVAVLLLEVQL